jgi:hypothetical protein
LSGGHFHFFRHFVIMSKFVYESESDDDLDPDYAVRHDHAYAATMVSTVCSSDSSIAPDVPVAPVSAPDSVNDQPTAPSTSGSLAVGLSLAKSYLANRVKDSTKTQYDRIYKIWKTFCSENEIEELAAGHEELASCLSLVMHDNGSLSKVSMLSAAIANEYRRNLKTSPTEHRSIGDLFKGFKASTDQTRHPMLPITEDIVRQMIDKVYHPSHGRDGQKASLVLWRTAWRVVMEYNTLGRYSDIVRLKRPGKQHTQ